MIQSDGKCLSPPPPPPSFFYLLNSNLLNTTFVLSNKRDIIRIITKILIMQNFSRGYSHKSYMSLPNDALCYKNRLISLIRIYFIYIIKILDTIDTIAFFTILLWQPSIEVPVSTIRVTSKAVFVTVWQTNFLIT